MANEIFNIAMIASTLGLSNIENEILGERFWRPRSPGSLFGILARIFCRPLLLLVYIINPLVKVRLGLLHHRSVGRLVSHTEFYFRRRALRKTSRREHTLFVSGTPVNRQILKMISRKVSLIESNFVWKLLDRIRILSLSNPIWINLRRSGFDQREKWYLPGPQMSYTDEENAKGRRLQVEMGIPEDAQYICFHARDKLYRDSPDFSPDEFWYENDFRYCHEKNYLAAADYLTRQGFYVIRMGFMAERPLETDNPMIIDYPVSVRCHLKDRDFADAFLCANCKFFLGDTSGIYLLASAFGIPIAYANMIPICDNGRTEKDIFIPRKYWHVRSERYLPYRMILERGWEEDTLTREQLESLSSDGIEIVENSANEILDLAVEMNMRLDGTWIPEKEDGVLMDLYRHIFPDGHDMRDFPGLVGARFLRENRGLLGPRSILV